MTSEKISKSFYINDNLLQIKNKCLAMGLGGNRGKPQHRQARFSKFSKAFFFAAKFCCKEMLMVTPH
jgi:hypothetical protein